MLLPSEDARFLLLVSSWSGLKTGTWQALNTALLARESALRDAVAGKHSQPHADADVHLRAKCAETLSTLAYDMRATCTLPTSCTASPGNTTWEGEVQRFLVYVLCSARDASNEERAIATQRAERCVTKLRAGEGMLAGRIVVQCTLVSLRALRMSIQDTNGSLGYQGASLMHRVVSFIFGDLNLIMHNARRARLAVLCVCGGAEFETVLSLIDKHTDENI